MNSRTSEKIVSRERLIQIVETARKLKKKIVTVNGAFDLLHPGHEFFLREAKKEGDVLIVGLNSDTSVRSLKGPLRPILSEESRAQNLTRFEMVDFVTIFSELTPLAFLEIVKPDVHVNGAEYGENCIESEIVRQNGGLLKLVERLPFFSTTNILKHFEGSSKGPAF